MYLLVLSLVWITKAFNLELEWLLNLWERGKPQNKPSEKGAVTQLENANLKRHENTYVPSRPSFFLELA